MKKLVTLAAGLALVATTAAQAQVVSTTANPGSVTTYATVTVNQILRLTVSDTSTAIGSPTEAQFDAGFQDVGAALSATIKSNKAFTLSISAGAGAWSGPYAKAVGDLRWRTAGAAPGTALTGSPVAITTSAVGDGNSVTNVSYDIVWDYANDVPGTYSVPVVFTAAAP